MINNLLIHGLAIYQLIFRSVPYCRIENRWNVHGVRQSDDTEGEGY